MCSSGPAPVFASLCCRTRACPCQAADLAVADSPPSARRSPSGCSRATRPAAGRRAGSVNPGQNNVFISYTLITILLYGSAPRPTVTLLAPRGDANFLAPRAPCPAPLTALVGVTSACPSSQTVPLNRVAPAGRGCGVHTAAPPPTAAAAAAAAGLPLLTLSLVPRTSASSGRPDTPARGETRRGRRPEMRRPACAPRGAHSRRPARCSGGKANLSKGSKGWPKAAGGRSDPRGGKEPQETWVADSDDAQNEAKASRRRERDRSRCIRRRRRACRRRMRTHGSRAGAAASPRWPA